MRVYELFRSILDALPVHDNRRYSNDNDEVEHMRSVEVEREQFIFHVLHEVLLGLARVTQLIYRICHNSIFWSCDGAGMWWQGVNVFSRPCCVRLCPLLFCCWWKVRERLCNLPMLFGFPGMMSLVNKNSFQRSANFGWLGHPVFIVTGCIDSYNFISVISVYMSTFCRDMPRLIPAAVYTVLSELCYRTVLYLSEHI